MNLNEGVFDIFSKKQRVINALITRRTAERDAADTQSDQLGLSMNTYLNHRDASRTADDRIEKLKLRKKGERGRDYTDGMNAGALEWFKKEKKKGKKKKKQTNEETLHELRKSTVQSFIKGREQQADSAWDNSQIAKKAWLGNSRKTGIWDPVVPRVVGQIGKIGQHDDALLRTATIFDKRSEQAKASADKAKLRLSGNKTKKENTMQNEEYTQVLEQMILTLTGMKLEQLHEAVGGQLTEMSMTPSRNQQLMNQYSRHNDKFTDSGFTDKEALKNQIGAENTLKRERNSKKRHGMGGRVLDSTKGQTYEKNVMKSLTAKGKPSTNVTQRMSPKVNSFLKSLYK